MEKVAIRVFTLPKNKTEKKTFRRIQDPLVHHRVLVFDTETTIDEFQNLKIGHFRIMHDDLLQHEGFILDLLTLQERSIIERYATKHHISIYTRGEFIEKVFYNEVFFNRTLCIGFNLPFDLSRLAQKFSYARDRHRGGFSILLTENSVYPRLRIRQLHSDHYSISFASSLYNKGKSQFRGYFLDVQRLAAILTDRKRISLKDACNLFNTTTKKQQTDEHGKITPAYLDYLLADVQATYEVFCKAKEEYDRYGITLPLTQAYSSASLGKQALRQLGIKPFMLQNPDFPPSLLGQTMSAYIGGRTECKIRNTPTLVSTLDFTSMYPSVTILMGLWEYIIADKIAYEDDTQNVQQLIDTITPEALLDKSIWARLNVLVELEPDDTLLPVRANYNQFREQHQHQEGYTPKHRVSHQDVYTIGLNHITLHQKSLFYPLCDVLAHKILTKKHIIIKKAIRFSAVSSQKSLKTATILGMTIDPTRQNFIKDLVEQRQRLKEQLKKTTAPVEKAHLLAMQKALKILANSTTYGIFVELNPDDSTVEQEVYSNTAFSSESISERKGEYFHPIVAVNLVSGARLLLALAEEYVTSRGQYYAYMDTDSISVHPDTANGLSEYFQQLNPYNADIQFLKIEKRDKTFYGISSKRYCLATVQGKHISIDENRDDREYKLHGLGHLMNPLPNKRSDWQRELWLDILRLHYKQITHAQLYEKYNSYYALTQMTVSTPSIMRKLETINHSKSLHQQIKPFNFVILGVGNKDGIKPLAPYDKEAQNVVHKPFTDYKTGKTHQGIEYWQPISTFLNNYLNHPEDKFKGDIGILERRHLKPQQIIHIGKETKNIDKQTIEQTKAQQHYNIKKILDITPEQARAIGITNRSTLKRIKDKIRKEKKLNIKTTAVQKLLSLLG